jgi:cytoskeleton protein RodZ
LFELGNSLREARLRQHLDFPEVEQATKIRAKYLRALEAEQFDQLPSQTYVKGFLRSYAEYLGLEGQLFVDEYNSRFVASDDDLLLRPRRSSARPPRQREHRRIERNVVVLTLVAIGVIAALIIAAWKFGGSSPSTIPNLKNATKQTAASKKKKTQSKPAAPARKPGVALLVVKAVRGPSYLAVRVGSVTGRVLYQGTLEKGHAIPFQARKLWLQLTYPTNVVLRLNGNYHSVGGTKPRVLLVTSKSISAAGPGT